MILIKEMVNSFLKWKLPKDFKPDCYISFDRDGAEKVLWPTGTNILNAEQVEDMFKHILVLTMSNDACIDYAERYADLFKDQKILRVDLVNAVYHGMRLYTSEVNNSMEIKVSHELTEIQTEMMARDLGIHWTPEIHKLCNNIHKLKK